MQSIAMGLTSCVLDPNDLLSNSSSAKLFGLTSSLGERQGREVKLWALVRRPPWHSREGGSCLVLVVETTTTTGTAFPVTTTTLVKRLSLSSRNYNTLTWKTGSGNSIVLVVKTTTTTTSPVTRTPWPERLDHSGKAVELSSRLIRFNRWLLPINSDLVLTVDCLGKRLTKKKRNTVYIRWRFEALLL